MLNRSATFLSALITVLILILFGPTNTPITADPAPADTGLFTPLETAAARPASADILRTRPVTADGRRLLTASAVDLNLFADLHFTARRTGRHQTPHGNTVWTGRLDDDPAGSAVFVVQADGRMHGNIDSLHGHYTIAPADESTADRYTITHHHPDATAPTEADVTDPPIETQDTVAWPPTQAADDGSIIDVLVVYTGNAAANVGTANILSYVDLFTAYTNQAYESSQINQRIAIAGTAEVVYDDSHNSTSTSLDDLVAGNIPNVFALRDEYHADLVLMMFDYPGGGCAGRAYLQTFVNQSFQDNGYGVMNACSFGASVYAHELGHNMGGRHDWFVDSGTTPYTYAHGHVDSEASIPFRTIMAYNNECNTVNGSSCNRVPHFSNPDVSVDGRPTGIAGGTGTSCTEGSTSNNNCDADSARTFDNTAANTAQFRQSRITWTGNNGSDWNTAANWEIVTGHPNEGTTTVNRVPRAIDHVYIPAGPGNTPTISSGSHVARAVTIADGAQFDMSGGTLTVGHNWTVEGGGAFNGTGGTVIFGGPLDQTVTANANTTFHHVQMGDGDTQTISLAADIDINGDLTIADGVAVQPENYMIQVAGDWTEQGLGFNAADSSVQLDGTLQTVSKNGTANLLTQDFNQYTGCGCTTAEPSGWQRGTADGNGFLFGELSGVADGSAIMWNNSTDAWLHSAAVSLVPNVEYELTFQTADRFDNATFEIDAYIGTEQTSNAMLNGLTLGQANDPSGSSYATHTFNFTVSTANTYYIGFRGLKSSGSTSYGLLDNVSLNGTQLLTFHNLTIGNGSTTAFQGDTTVNNDLQTTANSIADFGSYTVTVDGTVTNAGRLRQTATVSAGPADLLTITNAAGDATVYRGVRLDNLSAGMGAVVVTVAGRQTCGVGSGAYMQRCYTIDPATAQTADVRFWYTETERNSQDASTSRAWRWTGSDWVHASSSQTYSQSESGSACTSGGGSACWVAATAVTDYSQSFAIGGGPDATAPEAIVTLLDGSTIVSSGGAIDFGTTLVGTPITRTLTVSNSGTADLTVSNLSIGGDFVLAADFSRTTIPADETATFAVALPADTTLTAAGSLTFDTNDADRNPYTADLTGIVDPQPEAIALLRDDSGDLLPGSTVDFGTVQVGNPVTHTFTVRNDGDANLTVSGLTVPTGFTIVDTFSSATISPGNTADFRVALTAASADTYSGDLSFDTNDADRNPYTITLTGEVFTPTPALTVLRADNPLPNGGELDFGLTLPGQPLTETIELTNTGTDDLVLGPAEITAVDGTPFTVSNPLSTTLAPQQSVMMNVIFTATAARAYTGTLAFTTNVPGQPTYTLNLLAEIRDQLEPEIALVVNNTSLINQTGVVSYGTTLVGRPLTLTFTVENRGGVTLTLDAPQISGDGFAITAPLGDTALPARSSTTFEVALTAVAADSYTATLSLGSNDADENPFEVSLAGTVNMPPPTVYPTYLPFIKR